MARHHATAQGNIPFTPEEEAEADALEAEHLAQAPQRKSKEVEQAIQTMLDTEAQTAGYDSLLSVCSYSTSTGPFQPDGKSFIDWRDACWSKVISIQQEVLAGTRAEPTVDEVLALMPVRVI